jgi:hypothetical protein
LENPEIESRWRRNLSLPFKKALEFYSAFHTMGKASLFLWVRRPERGTNHPSPSGAKVKERVELYIFAHPLGFHGLFYSGINVYPYSLCFSMVSNWEYQGVAGVWLKIGVSCDVTEQKPVDVNHS